MKPKHISSKYKGMSFADAADRISKKYSDRDINSIQERSFEYEMAELIRQQNIARAREKASEQLKCGGKIRKYQTGTEEPLEGTDIGSGLEEELQEGLPTILPFELLPATNPREVALEEAADWQSSKPDITVETPEERKSLLSLDDPYLPAFVGKGIETALNIGNLIGGYDKVASRRNPFQDEIRRAAEDFEVDNTAAMDAIKSHFTAMRKGITGRNPQLRQALEANYAAMEADALAKQQMQTDVLNQRGQMMKANVLQGLGQEQARADFLADELNAQNKAAYQNEISKLGLNVTEVGKFLTEKDVKSKNQLLLLDIINKSHQGSIQLSKNFFEDFLKGKASESDMLTLRNIVGEANMPSFTKYMKSLEKKGE